MKIQITMSVLIVSGLSRVVDAVSPVPDGGYPGGNTAEGQNALFSLSTGTYNTALGFLSLRTDTDGQLNTASGAGALLANSADQNTATGAAALLSNSTGFGNTAVGCLALVNKTTGDGNTAVGLRALSNITSGENNIAVGADAGSGNTGGGSNNIYIGNGGRLDSETIRIGIQDVQTRTFIAGISATAIVSGAAVAIDGDGQLGVALSSRRFKKQIEPMDHASEGIFALEPVTFRYKNDKTNTPQFGLIAEDVAKVNSDLVVRDKEGKPYSVRYEQVNAMLLNEFLKEHKRVEAQQSKIEKQGATIATLNTAVARQRDDFRATVAQQQKDIQVLKLTLKRQAEQIQKATTQLKISRSATDVTLNNP